MATTTWNDVDFEVSSHPSPTRIVTMKGTTGVARFIFDAPLYTSGSDEFFVNDIDLQIFEEAICGFTQIDVLDSSRLNRNFPFPWPRETEGALAAIGCRLPDSGRGAMPLADGLGTISPVLRNLAPYEFWPGMPRNIYDIDFGPLPWSRFLDDTEAYAGVSPPRELGRYVKVDQIYTPREFRRPDYGFVTDNVAARDVLQVWFVPFIQAEVEYRWFQVPYPDGLPWQTIQDTLLHVNSTDFDGDELTDPWLAGQLLFTRTSPLDAWYFGPGGRKYVDVIYNFTFSVQGWNNYLQPDGTIVALKRKNVTPATPPYPGADYTQLFNPGAP